MRVLHVDTATEWRGGQQQLAWLASARGDAWAGVPGAPLAERLGPPAIALLPGNHPVNAVRLRRAARAWEVIAAHTPHAHGLALFSGAPVIVHRRVDFPVRHPAKYRRAAGIVAVSDAVRAVLARDGLHHVRVVHDGVPSPEPAPPLDLGGPVAAPVWGAAGALVAHKGHVHLLDAMRELPGTLLLAGEGPLLPALRARAAALGDRVRFLGAVRPIGALFASIDVFVHPSVEEGFGQVVVEAMAAGCRVAATTAGGVPEGLGDAGELAPPGDAVALAAAMRRALARPRGEGVARAATFSVARMVRETGDAYAALLAAR